MSIARKNARLGRLIDQARAGDIRFRRSEEDDQQPREHEHGDDDVGDDSAAWNAASETV